MDAAIGSGAASRRDESSSLSMTPSDFTHVLLIKHLIFANRKKQVNVNDSLNMLCFLSDSVRFSRCTQYSSARILIASLAPYLSSNHTTTNATYADAGEGKQASVVLSLLKSIELELDRITKLDDLFNVVTEAKEVFEVSAFFSQNEVCGPTKVSRDSNLGLFLRVFLSRWESMGFESICTFFENMRSFLLHRSSTSNMSADLHKEYRALSYNFDQSASFNRSSSSSSTSSSSNGSRSTSSSMKTPVILDHTQYFVSAQKSVAERDVGATEAAIHNFFDSEGDATSSSSSAAAFASGGDGNESVTHLVRVLDKLELMNSRDICANTTTFSSRLPLAMISLASMWITAKSYSLAAGAAEEAMKTAHQRRDHVSVAKSLLLLFYIYNESQDGTFRLEKAEELLLRCLYRCNSLNLTKLITEVAVMLVDLRSKGKVCSASYGGGVDNGSGDKSDGQSGGSSIGGVDIRSNGTNVEMLWPMAALWMQLTCASLGKASLLLNVLPLANTNSLHSVLSTQSVQTAAQSGGLTANPLFAARKTGQENSPRDELMIYNKDYADFAVKAGLAAVNLWLREDMFFMAELACRRVFEQCASFSSIDLLVSLVNKYVVIQTDIITTKILGTCFISSSGIDHSPKNTSELVIMFKRLVLLCDSFGTLHSPSRNSSDSDSDSSADCSSKRTTAAAGLRAGVVREGMMSAKLYVLIHAAICERQFAKAERLAHKYIELQAQSYMDHADAASMRGAAVHERAGPTSFNNIHREHKTDNEYECTKHHVSSPSSSALFQPYCVGGSITEELLRAKLILAIVLHKREQHEQCVKLLSEIEEAALRVDLVRMQVEAAVMRHVLILNQHMCGVDSSGSSSSSRLASGGGGGGASVTVCCTCVRGVASITALQSLQYRVEELGMMKLQHLILTTLSSVNS